MANREEGLKGRESGECAIPLQLEEVVWEKTGANTQSTEEQASHLQSMGGNCVSQIVPVKQLSP